MQSPHRQVIQNQFSFYFLLFNSVQLDDHLNYFTCWRRHSYNARKRARVLCMTIDCYSILKKVNKRAKKMLPQKFLLLLLRFSSGLFASDNYKVYRSPTSRFWYSTRTTIFEIINKSVYFFDFFFPLFWYSAYHAVITIKSRRIFEFSSVFSWQFSKIPQKI